MTRLIDADAIKYEPLPKHDRNYRTYNLDDAYDDGYSDAMVDIRNAPTVDAIPVEFIKERREAYLENLLADDNLTAGKKIVKASALQELLNAWERKEE